LGFQLAEVGAENGVSGEAVLKAAQLPVELTRAGGGERIDHPLPLPFHLHEAALAEVGKVLGDGHLRQAEDVLEMADAEGRVLEEMHDAETGLVAEAVVDFDERQRFHTYEGIYLNGYIMQGVVWERWPAKHAKQGKGGG